MRPEVFLQHTASQSVSCSIGKNLLNSRRKREKCRKCVSTFFFISGHSPAFAFIAFLSLSLNARLSSPDSRPLFFGTPLLTPSIVRPQCLTSIRRFLFGSFCHCFTCALFQMPFTGGAANVLNTMSQMRLLFGHCVNIGHGLARSEPETEAEANWKRSDSDLLAREFGIMHGITGELSKQSRPTCDRRTEADCRARDPSLLLFFRLAAMR